MLRPLPVFVLAAAVLSVCGGCTQPQRAYRIQVHNASPDPVGQVVRALAAEGLEAASVDGSSGVIHTRWQDTGFLFGKIHHQNATLVRRYTAVVSPQGTGAVLRLDVKRCVQGGYSIGEIEIRGACEAVDGILEMHQQELDALGDRIQESLGREVVATGAPSI